MVESALRLYNGNYKELVLVIEKKFTYQLLILSVNFGKKDFTFHFNIEHFSPG